MIRCIADLHTHTVASGHAYGTIREMAQGASEKNIFLLGITEHGPGIPGTADPIYYSCLSQVPRVLFGVEMLFGSEVNLLDDGSISLEDKVLNQLDYGIIGIHTICYSDCGREGNTEKLIQCLKHEKILFVSHPDDDHTPLDYSRLVVAAGENHVALEVNNSSFRKLDRRINCINNYRKMLEHCKKEGVYIIVSSDAHDPSRIADHALALSFLEEVGFPEELVLNSDINRIKAFLK